MAGEDGSGSVGTNVMDDWNRITKVYYSNFDLLCKDIWSGRIEELPPREILWKVLLIYRTFDQQFWKEKDQELIKKYERLLSRFGDVQKEEQNDGDDDDDNDPLNVKETLNNDTSATSSKEDVAELISDITKDVERTFPENEFFQSPKTQSILIRLLYLYARSHPDIGYRQGMHELLGPFIYILASESEGVTFALFEVVMQYAKQWYAQSYTPSASPPIVAKANHIQEEIIKPADPQLYALLTTYSIAPQIWAIRWVRLLFSREFGFEKTLDLWDSIFAAMISTDLSELVNYICATMLIRIRSLLLKEPSQQEILTTVLNYPITPKKESPRDYVANAQYLRRNPSVIGGKHLAEHYSTVLFPESSDETPPGSPRLNLETLMGAAKSYSQKWEIDRRFKEAVNGVRQRTPNSNNHGHHSAHSSIGSISDISEALDPPPAQPNIRNKALADKLQESLDILTVQEGVDSRALDGIQHVKECLLHPEKSPSVTKKELTKKPDYKENSRFTQATDPGIPQPSLSTSSRVSKKTTLSQSEFSWMLDSPKQQQQQQQQHHEKSKFSTTKDLFELS